jgi:hypothetical protein
VGLEYDIQMFDMFKCLDIFYNTFAVTSLVQILGTVPFEKLVVSDKALLKLLSANCGNSVAIEVFTSACDLFPQCRMNSALSSLYVIYLCIHYFGSGFKVYGTAELG